MLFLSMDSPEQHAKDMVSSLRNSDVEQLINTMDDCGSYRGDFNHSLGHFMVMLR